MDINFENPSLAGQYFLDGEYLTENAIQIGTIGVNGAFYILTPPGSYISGPNNGSAYLHSSIYSSIFLQTTNYKQRYFHLIESRSW